MSDTRRTSSAPAQLDALSRRDFLKLSGLTSLGLVALTACGPAKQENSGNDEPADGAVASTFAADGNLHGSRVRSVQLAGNGRV